MLQKVYEAREAIKGVALRTPLVPSTALSEITGAEVRLKLETTQPVGAFKIRGAANAISRLDPDHAKAGVVCVSTGNHGRAVAYAASRRGIRSVICMSQLVPENKREAIRALGAEICITGESQDDAQKEVDRLVREEGLKEISPFDDVHVVAGQATIGLELLEDWAAMDVVIVPLSGGGLLGGIAAVAKAANPDIRVIGVSMERGAAMQASLAAGHPVQVAEEPSLADSLGGGIGLGNRVTFGLCRDFVDEVVLVSEAEIAAGMRHLYFREGIVSEGAAAVGTALMLRGGDVFRGRRVATVVSGRNVDMQVFTDLMRDGGEAYA